MELDHVPKNKKRRPPLRFTQDPLAPSVKKARGQRVEDVQCIEPLREVAERLLVRKIKKRDKTISEKKIGVDRNWDKVESSTSAKPAKSRGEDRDSIFTSPWVQGKKTGPKNPGGGENNVNPLYRDPTRTWYGESSRILGFLDWKILKARSGISRGVQRIQEPLTRVP
jgi:hypothetical protein